ncbi:MAG: amidohydrolase [Nitrospinae bacterium]|nr:amidohydrolase [Nitrospinota bacterium]
MNITDAHVHLITAGMADSAYHRYLKLFPAFPDAVRHNAQKLFGGGFPEYLAQTTIEQQAREWLSQMDKHGVSRVVFFPIAERLEEMRDFIRHAPGRFYGYAFIEEPAGETAPVRLKTAVNEFGLCGLKLYPSIQMFHPGDAALFPLYEEAQSLGIPITFHFGISNAPIADYRFVNPMEIQLPLKLFPRLNFIIAHFGAGYFREACLLGFHNKNIHLDTSGTNNWREYTPEKMPLEEVFRRAVAIYSAERILFGTDSLLRPGAGYRGAIKEEQIGIVQRIGISESEQALVMGENAERLLARDGSAP